MSPTVQPTDTYHHGDLRTACVEAGLQMVATGGPEAVTIRGVSRLIGVSHTAPLHHFQDRDRLIAAVAQAGFDRLMVTMAPILADPTLDPLDRLRRYGLEYVGQAIAQPGLYRLMFGKAACETGLEAYELLLRLVIATGLNNADPERPATMVWAQVHGLAGLYAEGKLAHELDGLPAGAVPPRAVRALDDLIAVMTATSIPDHRQDSSGRTRT